MLLTGTYPRTLDDKNRLGLPKRLRELLGEPANLCVMPGQDQCLWIYSEPAAAKLVEKLERSQGTDAEVRVFRRLFFAQTETVDVDRSGRILMPERLTKFAGLKHEVTLIGAQDHLEVWDAQRWQEFYERNAPRFDAVAEAAFGARTKD